MLTLLCALHASLALADTPTAVAPEATASDPAVADDGNGAVPEAGPPRGRGGRRPQGEKRPPPGDHKPEDLFRFGGDFQVNFAAEHLERSATDTPAPPAPTFTIAHLRPRVDMDATPWLALRASVEMADVPESPPEDPQMVGDQVAVSTDVAILNPSIDELYLKLHAGNALRQGLRMGAVHTAFGLRDDYDRYDAFFLGGQLAYMEPERRFGISEGNDIGVAWRVAYKDLGALDLQLLNGSGVTKIDADAAKDIVARITLSPTQGIEARGSIMTAGNATDGHTDGAISLQLSAGRFLPAVNPRIVAEGILSRTVSAGVRDDRIAWMVAAAADVPVRSNVTDHLSIVASHSRFDPKFVTGGAQDASAFDQQWYTDIGANLYWNTEGRHDRGAKREHKEHGPETTAYTGLTFEDIVPQNAQLPISNSIVLQCGLSR